MWVIRSKNSYFWYVFDSFSPFNAQERASLTSLFAHYPFNEVRLKRFAPIALYKRATWAIRSGHSLRSLITKERLWAIQRAKVRFATNPSESHYRSFAVFFENWWANSQPCTYNREKYVPTLKNCVVDREWFIPDQLRIFRDLDPNHVILAYLEVIINKPYNQ